MDTGGPDLVSPRLRSAARHVDSFYGLLARRSLGIEPPPRTPKPDFLLADWQHVDQLPCARRAAALVEIGELGLADRELRHLAMLGPRTEERRVGKEAVSTCRSCGSTYHKKKKT